MFILSTDTCVDLAKGKLDELNIKYVPMTYTLDGKEYTDDFNSDEDYNNFYRSIDSGVLVKTSQCSQFAAEEHFRKILNESEGDVLHLCLSSGISGTYDSAIAAAETVLSESEFKGRNIYCVDSKSGAAGQYLLADIACEMRARGRSAKETFDELNKHVPNMQHWVYIDDLTCLRRGGRIGAITAVIGSVLHVKPVAIINSKGKIRLEKKTIGMRKAFSYIADKVAETSEKFTEIDNNPEKLTIYIGHANCSNTLNVLIDVIKEKVDCRVKTANIGPLIGAHVGPGALGVFFLGKPRFLV